MDRGLLLLILCSCGRSASAPAGVDAEPFALPITESLPADGPPEPDAEPIGQGSVLSGPAAEQAIASGKTVDRVPGEARPEETGVSSDGPAYLIGPDRVGPFRLGASRADVIRLLAGKAVLQRVATPVGEPSVEVAMIPNAAGTPLLRLRLYAGRLQEVHVVTRDRRAVTATNLGVGATFGEAIDTYGDAVPVREARTGRRLGFVLQDLAGVVLVPADLGPLLLSSPPPTARIARILVLGPEATAPED